jgi:hypothetical protein
MKKRIMIQELSTRMRQALGFPAILHEYRGLYQRLLGGASVPDSECTKPERSMIYI